MNILQRFTRWFLEWFREPPAVDPFEIMARFEREQEIDLLILGRLALRCRIDGLRKSKKKHSHLSAKLTELTNRQMELEALTYGPGMEIRK